MTEILVVCTANLCRSPMAAALLVDALERGAAQGTVRSAGVRGAPDLPPPDAVVDVMATRGLDVGAHRSRRVEAADIQHADLVVAMERAHVQALVVLVPDAFGRTFTLKELVRRAETAGSRGGGEPLAQWLGRIHSGRRASALLGSDPDDDVDDPMGGPPERYRRTADELADLTTRLVALAFPRPPAV